MGKLIRLFLVDDRPEGMRTLEISNLTVKATVFPRPLLNSFAKREEANKPGVYLLYGEPLEQEKPKLYIGEGDPVLDRLKTHSIKKDFWTEAFVFTSKDGYLTKTQIQYLESRLIAMASEAGRVILDNALASTEPTLSEVDRAEVAQFLDSIKTLISAMRINYFEPPAQTAITPNDDEIIYEYKVKECFGKMAIRNGQYILLRGSMAARSHRPSANRAIQSLREDLMAKNILIEHENGLLDVTQDIPFSSASYAAAVICGGNVNGLVSWKYQGKTLKQIELESTS